MLNMCKRWTFKYVELVSFVSYYLILTIKKTMKTGQISCYLQFGKIAAWNIY